MVPTVSSRHCAHFALLSRVRSQVFTTGTAAGTSIRVKLSPAVGGSIFTMSISQQNAISMLPPTCFQRV